jgi:hypothetical protein
LRQVDAASSFGKSASSQLCSGTLSGRFRHSHTTSTRGVSSRFCTVRTKLGAKIMSASVLSTCEPAAARIPMFSACERFQMPGASLCTTRAP